MPQITPAERRIGAKLRRVLDVVGPGITRRADYHPWILRDAGSTDADATDFVAVTIAFDANPAEQGHSDVKNALLRQFLSDNDLATKGKYPALYVPSRFERGRVRTLLKRQDIAQVASMPGVRFVGVSDPIYKIDALGVDQETRNEPPPGRLDNNAEQVRAEIGDRTVLIGLIDVEGFDVSHPDFMINDKTLFARIWDQNEEAPQGAPEDPAEIRQGRPEWADFTYGHEFDRDHIDQAIAKSGRFAYWRAGFPTTVPGSHGTHVASIAGGNNGICPNAILAGVVFARQPGKKPVTTRDMNHGDGERLRHAIMYLRALAEELHLPVVINISLGRHCGAHDGSNPLCREIDALSAGPGCCVVIAAGNAGDSGNSSQAEGRVHASGRVQRGAPATLQWRVENNDPTDNEMEIWYSERCHFKLTVTGPNNLKYGPVGIDQRETFTLPDDLTELYVEHTSYDPDNGCNYIFVQLSPRADLADAVVTAGLWKIELELDESSNAGDYKFHAWIERDDGSDATRRGIQSHFESENPSIFDNTKVNSLACGHNVIAVGNWDLDVRTHNSTSSQGPTRDGRQKPDIAAPGTKIWGANGFPFQVGSSVVFEELDLAARRYRRMSGTSMAAPFISGIAALMLSLNPYLTAAQIRAIMTRTARPLSRGWRKASGFGEINIEKCLEEALRIKA